MKAEKPMKGVERAEWRNTVQKLEKQLAEKEQKIKSLLTRVNNLEFAVAHNMRTIAIIGSDEKDNKNILRELNDENMFLKKRIQELEQKLKSHSDDEFQFGVNEVRQQAIQSERERIVKLCFENVKTTPEDEKVLYYEDLQTIARLLHEHKRKDK